MLNSFLIPIDQKLINKMKVETAKTLKMQDYHQKTLFHQECQITVLFSPRNITSSKTWQAVSLCVCGVFISHSMFAFLGRIILKRSMLPDNAVHGDEIIIYLVP